MAVEAEDLAARLKAEFPHALRSGQLVAYYQPEVELSSGRVVAAESLVRWEHPEFGTLPPALLVHADRAMYGAKRAGGGCWRLYEDTEQAADPALA
jgi:GGDEF domain-containing protein